MIVAALAAAAPQPQDRRETRPPQTDQTVTVPRGARLLLDNFAGEVIVRAGDGDSLRVRARHATRARVNVRTVPTGIRISSSAERGPVGSVDYEITAPRWMPIKIDGQFNFVTIEGSQAEVAVETIRGDVLIKGGNGISAKSIEGDVTVESAKGRINVSSVNQGVTVSACRSLDRRSGQHQRQHHVRRFGRGRRSLSTHDAQRQHRRRCAGDGERDVRRPHSHRQLQQQSARQGRRERAERPPGVLHSRQRQRGIRARIVRGQHPPAKARDDA
jgi:hypothetical protein